MEQIGQNDGRKNVVKRMEYDRIWASIPNKHPKFVIPVFFIFGQQ